MASLSPHTSSVYVTCICYIDPSESYPDTSTITQGSYYSLGDFLQSSLSKKDIWRTILAWAMCKREGLERKKRNHELTPIEQKKTQFEQKRTQFELKTPAKIHFTLCGNSLKVIYGHETRALEQETQALEMILQWVRDGGGKEALKRAEDVLDGLKPTNIEQHIMKLLKLMEQEYWRTQHPTSSRRGMSVFLRKEIFKRILEDTPKLIGRHRRFGLRNHTVETKFSTTLDKILRLSSWTPSSTHNKRLRELLRNALLMLNDLGGSEEYHEYLRDFMKRHTAFCAFTLDNADLITTEDTETTAELCKNLRRLAQNLGKIASTKAEQYQKLFEIFIAHKEELSRWLDSASPGQGKLHFWVLCITFYI